MLTAPTNRLSGQDRVTKYTSTHTAYGNVFFAHQDLIHLLKKKFNYLQIKMAASTDGKLKALSQELFELKSFVLKSKEWVETQEQVVVNLEQREFEIVTKCALGMQLLQYMILFDDVMTQLTAAQFYGNQSEMLRQNYMAGFSHHFHNLFSLAEKGDAHFRSNGEIRESFH